MSVSVFSLVLGVPDCPRCLSDHDSLEFKTFTANPLAPYDFYSWCPTLGEPLLKEDSGTTLPGLPDTTA